MREYGQVQVAFWSHPDTRQLSDTGRLLALYLMTGPHSNGLGCYYLPDGYIIADTGWDSETVSKGFVELFRNGFCERCETSFFVLIPNFLKWNPISNANVAKARESEFNRIPKSASVYSNLCSAVLDHGNHLSNRFETVLKRYSKQEPIPSDNEPREKREEPNIRSVASDTTPAVNTESLFTEFWNAYPSRRPHSNPKKPARAKFIAAIKATDPQTIIAGAKRYADYVSVHVDDPQKVAQAVTWLNQERWEDDLTDTTRTDNLTLDEQKELYGDPDGEVIF